MRLRSLEAVLIVLIVVASVEWTYLAYLRGMIDAQLAVTLVVVEAPTELALAWLISRVLEKPDELARKFAVEKQKLEEIDRHRKDIYEAIIEGCERDLVLLKRLIRVGLRQTWNLSIPIRMYRNPIYSLLNGNVGRGRMRIRRCCHAQFLH
jgi:hypothetical protein